MCLFVRGDLFLTPELIAILILSGEYHSQHFIKLAYSKAGCIYLTILAVVLASCVFRLHALGI